MLFKLSIISNEMQNIEVSIKQMLAINFAKLSAVTRHMIISDIKKIRSISFSLTIQRCLYFIVDAELIENNSNKLCSGRWQ